MKLTDELIAVLGKNLESHEAASIIPFVLKNGNMFDGEGYVFYESNDLGLNLTYDKTLRIFTDVFFHVKTASVSDGEVSAFKETLPYGITPKDLRKDVEKKLSGKPTYSISPMETSHLDRNRRWEDSYSIFPLRFIFTFEPELETLKSVFVAFTS